MAPGDRDVPVRVDVLGPLRLVVDGSRVEVPGPKRRALLALLTLAEGRTLPTDDIVEALWPADPPGSARQALHTHVSRLRSHLAPASELLQTQRDGYRFDLDRAAVDLIEARALLRRARQVRARSAGEALALLRQALTLWRGPVLADLTDIAPIAAAVQGFERLRQEVVDALVGAAVSAGQADTVLQLSTESLAADALREPAVLLQMRVLAATGRSAQSLDVARAYRHRLGEETGLDPSDALGELEREIAGGTIGAGVTRPSLPDRPVTQLIGREAQVAALHRQLASERLVTVVGPGGVGKTRAALEVARRTHDATVLLLAPVTDPAALPHALAGALDLDIVQGDVLAACLAVLGDRPGLLVIDNCEHLLDAVRDLVAAILAACPQLALLATSRGPLGLAAEYTWRLAPLPTPRPDDDPAQVPSVMLFLQRAERVRRGAVRSEEQLRTVTDIVRRLDGMPLAIELAAGRLSTLSLTDLRERLDRSLDLLGDGRPAPEVRHRTLRATLDWSYQLLSGDEQRLFRSLAIFPDGVDLATAEQLAAETAPGRQPAGVLAGLVDASMVEARFEPRTRFGMLETLRAYGLDRLAAHGESEQAASRLIRWAVDLTARLNEALRGDGEPEADAQLRRELGNLRTAWHLALDRAAPDDCVAIVLSLVESIAYRDLLEIRGWAQTLAEDPRLAGHPRTGEVFGVAAEAAYHNGDLDRAERLARAGLARSADPVGTSFCRQVLSVVELARGRYREAGRHAVAATVAGPLARDALGVAALAAAYGGDLGKARALCQAGIPGEGCSPSARAWNHYVAGEVDGLAGCGAPAEGHYLAAIELARAAGSTFLAGIASVGLVAVRARAGQTREALLGYRDVIDYFTRTGNWPHLWTTLRNLADLLRRLDDQHSADLIDAAANAAPEAPPVSHPAATAPQLSPAPPPSRATVIRLSRAAIARQLARDS